MSSTADVPSTSSDDCSRMNGTTGTIPNGLSVTDSVSQPPGPAMKSGDVDVNTDTCSGSNRIALVPSLIRSRRNAACTSRSEEHTSELQSRFDLVCRLLLEKKKKSISEVNGS